MTESTPIPKDDQEDIELTNNVEIETNDEDSDLQRADWEGMTPSEPTEVDEELEESLKDDLLHSHTAG